MMRRVAMGLVLGATVATVAGCATVAPYEREYLARRGMDIAREASAGRFHEHVRDAREGGRISSDIAGGGCGCN